MLLTLQIYLFSYSSYFVSFFSILPLNLNRSTRLRYHSVVEHLDSYDNKFQFFGGCVLIRKEFFSMLRSFFFFGNLLVFGSIRSLCSCLNSYPNNFLFSVFCTFEQSFIISKGILNLKV